MRDHLIAELHVRKAVAAIDPLVFFIDVLTPRIQSRDTGSETHTPGDASGGAVRSRPPSKAPIQIQAVLEELPHPRLPSPSIWLLGRVWMLATTATPSNALHIRYQGESLAMTGEYLSVKALTEEWEDESSHYLSAAASELCDGLPDAPSPRLVKAREQVLRAGVVTEGDLLFIASDPPRVGHLIPNHHNNTLGCRVNRDLALTAALHLPPQSLDKAELAVYRRTTADHWVLQSLPHGLCLGSRPALESASAPVDAGVDLLAFLRFGAFRIAADGRFHEHDGREE
ncbi:MAG: hypothetical protein NTY38_02885 [Acidobacteria bacterium]|nr:hypothetical protein [Acidobacteriota bacterium]